MQFPMLSRPHHRGIIIYDLVHCLQAWHYWWRPVLHACIPTKVMGWSYSWFRANGPRNSLRTKLSDSKMQKFTRRDERSCEYRDQIPLLTIVPSVKSEFAWCFSNLEVYMLRMCVKWPVKLSVCGEEAQIIDQWTNPVHTAQIPPCSKLLYYIYHPSYSTGYWCRDSNWTAVSSPSLAFSSP